MTLPVRKHYSPLCAVPSVNATYCRIDACTGRTSLIHSLYKTAQKHKRACAPRPVALPQVLCCASAGLRMGCILHAIVTEHRFVFSGVSRDSFGIRRRAVLLKVQQTTDAICRAQVNGILRVLLFLISAAGADHRRDLDARRRHLRLARSRGPSIEGASGTFWGNPSCAERGLLPGPSPVTRSMLIVEGGDLYETW